MPRRKVGAIEAVFFKRTPIRIGIGSVVLRLNESLAIPNGRDDFGLAALRRTHVEHQEYQHEHRNAFDPVLHLFKPITQS